MTEMTLNSSKRLEALATMVAFASGTDIDELAIRHNCKPAAIRDRIYTGLAEADLDRFIMLCHPGTMRISKNALSFVREDREQWLTAGKRAIRDGFSLVSAGERDAVAELVRHYGDYLDLVEESSAEAETCG